MKNLVILLFLSAFAIPVFAQSIPSVKIGDQTWSTENLSTARFRNGDRIPEAKTDQEWKSAGENGQPVWCWYGNDPANGEKYGRLYNWFAVNDSRGLAPEGWHIPTDKEWKVLRKVLGSTAGQAMKTTDGWHVGGNGTNASGFSGLPGGLRYFNGHFNGIGQFGHWWSSGEHYANDAWNRFLGFGDDRLNAYFSNKKSGFSVRCIKDSN